MVRPIRIEFPGAIYHITSRGNALLPIFENSSDKTLFLTILAQVVENYNWLCHGYCLMDNHYHLLIETVDPTLSSGMRQLNGTYTQAFNRKHKKVGHLFQGRYKSIIVERENYLLELCRYIVLNPVRANMVLTPGKYSWSSYNATAGFNNAPPFLTLSWILSHFGKEKPVAQKGYRIFVEQGLNQPSPWKDLKAQCMLGGDAFVGRLKHSLVIKQGVTEIPKSQRFISRPPLEDLFALKQPDSKPQRNLAIQDAYFTHGYTQLELSKFLGLHYSTISRLLKNKMSK